MRIVPKWPLLTTITTMFRLRPLVRLDIAPSDIIECNVPPYEPEFKIELLQPLR